MSRDSDVGAPRDQRSRMIHLDAGQRRDADMNCRTVIGIGEGLFEARVPFEALFLAHYRAIRELGRNASGPGVAVVALHVPTCALAARAWVAARPGVASLIIGRHSECDVLLDAPTLSLRHLALVVPPPASWEAHSVAFELLDLRTQQAFRDERGRLLEGLAAEGPAFVSCGPFALFFFQAGDPSDWPELATDAWAMLPDRVLVDERAAEPDRWRRGGYRTRPREQLSESRSQSWVTAVPAPLAPGEPLVMEGEAAVGALRITSERGSRRLAVGPRALARGILLGRYSRCDGSEVLAHDSISRAHLLVKQVGASIVGLDTASTEGTYVDGREHAVRSVALGEGEVAVLGGERAFVRWQPPE